jgi:tetratricopeptide (TPR) repeat protein
MQVTLSQGSQYAPPVTVCPARTGKVKQSMSRDTVKNLFIVPSMPRFYQQLLSGIGSYQELGNRIIGQIKTAHAFRQTEQVRELSKLLLNFPIKEYQLIGQYYVLWCGCRERNYKAGILENVIEQSQTYKTRALQSRAAIEVYQGNFTDALRFYAESFKTSPSVSEYIETTKAIAFIKSVEGFHDLALKDLEGLIPILRYAEPFAYYDILNSYAVELGEAGRAYEASNVSSIVLASPFAPAYPEWQDTHADLNLRQKRRSTVTITRTRKLPEQQPKPKQGKPKDNVIKFPTAKKLPMPDEDEFSIPLAPLQALGLILTAVLGDRITEDEVEKICNNYYRVIMDWYS